MLLGILKTLKNYRELLNIGNLRKKLWTGKLWRLV
jgi:hypothetical protein